MTVRKICIWPDPALKEIATPVSEVDDTIRTLVDDLFDTMYAANGVGLASTQIAVAKRVLVIDLDAQNERVNNPEIDQELTAWGYTGKVALINPEIISGEGKIVWEEGCLSVPGYTDSVTRKEYIVVRALDPHGKPFELNAHGLFAVAIQHEMDHLDGRVFVEYLSKIKRDVVKRKMLRIKETEDDGVVAASHL